ncbi:MAG TPA: MBL fold metallo-hydrolase [Blastocatellia bacterium]|nr:MBL fold metallo-hydrolase [Blastocatellia bacterium]
MSRAKSLPAIAAAFLLTTILSVQPMTSAQEGQMSDNPLSAGQDQKRALKFGEAIYQAVGFGNTFMVVTEAGNVIIDTSMPFNAARHKQLLQAENAGPIKYIILTHAHGDHAGGVPVWKQPDTKIVAQKNHAEFQHYQTRLNGFFARRNAAQFSLRIPDPGPWPGNYGAKIEPQVLFDDKYEFELGGVKFEVISTPGETPDHATVWIPKYRAAFIGDNFYASLPNIYTLRGTKPRWALDYVNSLNEVLALKPEIVLPSHGSPIIGNAEIVKQLTRYRDAIQYVHDETVKGMNAGKDVWTLMNEIKLPPDLDVGEGYGKLSWSVRGIYEGYAGWFDLNPATMYEKPASSVYPDVVKLAGGPDAVAKLAMERAQAGQAVEALHLSDIALAADANHRPALQAKLKALETLLSRCRNSNERGWLEFSISQVKSKLAGKP